MHLLAQRQETAAERLIERHILSALEDIVQFAVHGANSENGSVEYSIKSLR